MTSFLLAVSGSLAASIVVKVTIAAALALLGSWLARRSRAAVRHAIWAAAFGVLLLLPIASMVAPPVRIAVADRAAVPRALPVDSPAPPLPAVRPRARRPALAPPPQFSLPTLLLQAWALGVALSLLPMALSWWKVRVLRRSALPWRVAAGAPRGVELLLHEAMPGPMTCGVLHPAIVLPIDAPSWPPDDLNRALVHELEHVRRGDWISHCLARLVCAVYWFHPLVWMAWRQLGLEAERSCDDAVLGSSEATAYADQLVGLAQRLSASAGTPHLAMANRSDLARRVGALLDGRQRRGRAGGLVVAGTFAAAAALVFAMSPLRVVAAPQSKDAARLEFDAVSVKLENNATGEEHSHEHNDGGRLDMSGNLHRFLIRAYDITDGQLGEEPPWFRTHLYSIQAVSKGRTTGPQKMLMLRAALEDRFQLKLRQEQRDLPVYSLEVAPGGAKFRELAPGEKLDDHPAPPGMYARYFANMEVLTNNLNRTFGGPLGVDRPVVDRTNLTGRRYNAHLATVMETEDASDGSRTVSFPDLFHDIQSQMGLKLVPTKLAMPYFVVEHAAFPTPN